jgi:hypothetical protein
MIKKLFFLGALLVPGLAYGGNPSADLSVQIVPAGTTTSTQCPSTAPAEAQAAGFTTLVFCQDFTQQIPNSAGGAANPQGTTANWNGCRSGPGQLWYSRGGAPCMAPRMGQVTDATTGGLAMNFLMPHSQFYGGGPNLNTIGMDDGTGFQPNVGNYTAYPIASLVEITYRDNTATVPTTCVNQGTFDFFSGSHEMQSGNTQNNSGEFEEDFFENYTGGNGCQQWQMSENLHDWFWNPTPATSVWNSGGSGITWPPETNGGTNAAFWNNYHTIGELTTTDGANIEVCGYIDHQLLRCTPFPNGGHGYCTYGTEVNQSGCVGQKSELWFWWGDLGPDSGVDINAWVEGWRVWSCPAWNTGTSGPKASVAGVNTCYGTVKTD